MAPNGRLGAGPRCIAIVGPFQSGKTTLLEAILERTGAISRAGRVSNGDSVGDASAEARAHAMSIEPNVATVEFLGESMTFVDCPGSTEFLHEMRNVTPVCDAAVVVCEADERKIPALEIILRELEEADIPRFLFINKIDTATQRIRETLALLQQASRTPLLLRQIPLWKDGIARSEEHTSELQSRQYLVCRLLLEKKKTYIITPTIITSLSDNHYCLSPIS